MESIDSLARGVEQRAESCRLAQDFVGEEIARRCAQRIRASASPVEAAAIERDFYGGAPASQATPTAPRGCLGSLFGGRFRSTPGGTWRSTYNTFGYNQGLAYSMFDGLLAVLSACGYSQRSWSISNPM